MRIAKRNLFHNFNIFFFIGAFILIFNPPILSSVNAMHIVGVCSLAYLVFNINKSIAIVKNNNIWILLLGFVGVFFYLVLMVRFFNHKPISYTFMPVYYILDIIPFGIAVRIYSDKKNCQSYDFIRLLIQTGKLQAILALMAFFIPSVHTQFLTMLTDYGYTAYFEVLSNYRIYGLASSLTFAMPIVQTIFALLLLHPDCNGRIDIISILLLFFSAVINARISIVVAVIGLIILILFGKFSVKRKLVLISTIVLVLLGLFIFVMPLIKQYSPMTYDWLISGVEEIFMFLGGDNSSSYFSYATGGAQYKIPDDILGVLVGRGHTTMSADAIKYGYQSDIGFINDIWIGGITYLIMLYSLYIGYMVKLFKSPKSLISFIGILMLISVVVINIKGQAFAKASFSVFLFLVCVVELSETKKAAKLKKGQRI